ncbi:TPA: sugar phosphate isomerase/epimerase and 4-hydroxyphenylpyruvate domain-containing protein [Klebsiella quasipneumoniae]|uniref:bifunctional sugar phosphate isomerase/epimerase/4-hydroxyphenylpyruvate dioxygenase family protein n=1 Tax=Klebsiella quasipneumoniae TaxID=1463165 RepID=UPI00237D76F6|nr:TIM barrel protein [Klebsiella quasipneumoniae]MDL2151486.1 TIM barrel protein [Klebsiella quasipneumoniae]MDW2823537.1 TIM barrel protein [Klebsiella quasipneumoniae]HDC4342186.1 sugar phosphate isomerase/epimerase and 4-hydroxyphenylpyruvate domain-containing protein [Klebsiella quasipneumoniae]
MLRSIATVSISGTLPEKLHAIAAAGYQGVEIFENDLLYYTGTPAEIRQLAADLGLKITLFQPFRDFEGASRAQFAANMARARRKFALMHELGCETLLLCSNVQPDCSADSELQVADLRALATLEIFNDGFRASPNGATAKDGYRSLLWLEEQTRRRLPTCDADLFSPPPLPVYQGLEFIEFAASAAEAQRLGQHLQALGFQHEGSHRSRQVTLWRNGGARIVINHQPHSWADHFYQRHGVSLCAMALRVEHSASLVARARALGYATWQGDAGPNETPIPAICAPDGSLIYLIDAGEAIYERDFHLRDGVTVREDYLGIDHLALGMEADSRDNWVMFFRTVFGFSLEHEQTLPDPYGLVRSLAVRSPQGDIRLALNISQSRATQIARSVACYQGAGLQHAAFACRDLPAACDQLAEVARHTLPIPANYYDDLLARFGGELDVGQLQRQQLLYDRDPQGGDFLHLYTRPFTAGRFFFELTERRAGYALYGAANAAVRLAAMQYC